MKTETYKGRKIKVRVGRKGDWGKAFITVNGQTWTESGHDEEKVLANQRNWIDFVDKDPVVNGNNGAYWYAPGTYRLCPRTGIHPVALDGECRHDFCVSRQKGK